MWWGVGKGGINRLVEELFVSFTSSLGLLQSLLCGGGAWRGKERMASTGMGGAREAWHQQVWEGHGKGGSIPTSHPSHLAVMYTSPSNAAVPRTSDVTTTALKLYDDCGHRYPSQPADSADL